MKKFTKLLGIVLIMALVMSMGITAAFAADPVRITINRDSSYDVDNGAEGDREYTWYRVFTVVMDDDHTAEGGGVNADGTPGSITDKGDAEKFAYTATSAVATKLGSWDSTTNAWTKASGNLWFDLAPIAGTTNYSVAWDENVADTAANVQAAAAWLIKNAVYEDTGSMSGVDSTKDANDNFTQWTAEVPAGYYLVASSEGQNLVAATTDITINEKNSYPTIDKKQNDVGTSAEYKDDAVGVKVGDTIYYQVEVKVPADANRDIIVTDTMATGLTYDSSTGVTVKVGDTVAAAATIENTNDANYKAETAGTGETWKYTIHPTTATKGKYVVFTFQATVNSDALTSVNRKNDVELKYNNDHYVMTDTVEYDIGAAAIIKYDGATADLQSNNTLKAKEGKTLGYLTATFTLKDGNDNAINVSPKTAGGVGVYYVDPTSTSNEVTSDKAHNGVILIYGLDPDTAITYTLTETETEAGYNLIAGTTDLTVVKADISDVNDTKVLVAEATGVSAGDDSAAEANTITINATQTTKVENNSGTVLPSTGGIGTTIFYVVGSILVVAAGVLLITKKRMGRE